MEGNNGEVSVRMVFSNWKKTGKLKKECMLGFRRSKKSFEGASKPCLIYLCYWAMQK